MYKYVLVHMEWDRMECTELQVHVRSQVSVKGRILVGRICM